MTDASHIFNFAWSAVCANSYHDNTCTYKYNATREHHRVLHGTSNASLRISRLAVAMLSTCAFIGQPPDRLIALDDSDLTDNGTLPHDQ